MLWIKLVEALTPDDCTRPAVFLERASEVTSVGLGDRKDRDVIVTWEVTSGAKVFKLGVVVIVGKV